MSEQSVYVSMSRVADICTTYMLVGVKTHQTLLLTVSRRTLLGFFSICLMYQVDFTHAGTDMLSRQFLLHISQNKLSECATLGSELV